MSLRPRYSLLTLLILTALVAGGVKLWYGPHRVSIGETPTAFEQTLLEQGQAMGFTTAEWQYDYRREWQGTRIMSVTCFPTTAYYMAAFRSSPHEPTFLAGQKFLFSEENYLKFESEHRFESSSTERVRCWIQSGRSPVYRKVQSQSLSQLSRPPNHKSTHQEIVSGAEFMQSCLVTEQGNIYELRDSFLGIEYNKIPLDKVVVPEVRARVAEELQKLPTTP